MRRCSVPLPFSILLLLLNVQMSHAPRSTTTGRTNPVSRVREVVPTSGSSPRCSIPSGESPDLLAVEPVLVRVDRDRCVRRLVGINLDDHLHEFLRFVGCEPRRALLPGSGSTPLSSHTAAKPRPSRSSLEGQTQNRIGGHLVNLLDQDLSNATKRPQRPLEASSRHISGSPSVLE